MSATPIDVTSRLALDANGLAALKQQAKTDPRQALSAAASQFEALFMQMLLKSMREALPHDGPLDSESTKAYTGMFDSQVSQQLAKKGIGVADMLVKQLARGVAGGTDPASAGSADKPAALAPAARFPLRVDGAGKPAPLPLTAPLRKADLPVKPVTGAVGTTVQGFIDKLRPFAEAAAKTMGVPAQYLIAQAGLETGWGKSLPKGAGGVDSKNLFGVKAGSSWKGSVVQASTTEFVAGQATKTQAGFRAYASYGDAFADFAKLLQSSQRYAGALADSHDAQKYATGLQKGGYATDPHYADKLTRAIQTVARYAPVSAPPASAQVVASPADKRADLA